MINTCYGPVHQNVIMLAKKIRLLICDVDGVLSNGFIIMGNHGEKLKTFHVRDGFGIISLKKINIEVAFITADSTQLLQERANNLGITHVYQGQSNKLLIFYKLLKQLSLREDQVAYIGDDVIDLPVMSKVGLSVSVKDAHPLLISKSHYITRIAGGYGAVRELCDIIIFSQNNL
ncbi:3-deoxy-D-manno-octulosonate 8-phosphate phosphatase KdsC [Candidatus Ecksteinia adelgidicola]|nr:3-deoxy-D-manno-octulosonate 8-phosphate phosphatase KdsC [Candidatus Ecksteinia adelgidicola]